MYAIRSYYANVDESIHKLAVELARFADTKNISVVDIKHLMSFDDPEKQKIAVITSYSIHYTKLYE